MIQSRDFHRGSLAEPTWKEWQVLQRNLAGSVHAAPWPHSSSMRGVNGFVFHSLVRPSKGNAGPQVERISRIIPLYSLVGKIVGKAAEHIFPAVWMHLGNTSRDQDGEGHCGTPSWYCRVASCSPGPLTPSVSYRWSVGWITTYFWSCDLEFVSLQTLKCISCEPSYCFFIIGNEIQVPLSKVLPLNFDNAYPLKYVISWK